MKVALCTSLEGPDGLVLADAADPLPAAGQVVVAVKAVGLNFADLLITRGAYQYKPELPFSPGAEIAGVVERIGDGVRGLGPGDRVMAYIGWGGAAEKVAVDAEKLVPIVAAVADDVAAGLSVTYGTAMHGFADRGRLQAGETVVVTGAAGGAGRAAVEVAKLMGARVIAVASSSEKLDTARAAGADAALLYPGVDLKAAVKALTNGLGADVVYDCIGGDASEALVRALAWRGRFLVVGFASGEIADLPLNLLLVKGAEAIGVFWAEAMRRDPERHRQDMQLLLRWVADGRLNPRIHATFPLAGIADAMRLIDGRAAHGKVVLKL